MRVYMCEGAFVQRKLQLHATVNVTNTPKRSHVHEKVSHIHREYYTEHIMTIRSK